jgi:hypothetical protein
MRTPRRIHGSACSALILRSRAERGVSKDEGGRFGRHRSRVYPRSAILVHKSGKPDLCVRDARLRRAPHHEAGEVPGFHQ